MAKQIKSKSARSSKLLPKKEIEAAKLAVQRSQTPLLLLQNPNYFGTLKGAAAKKFGPVVQLGSQKTYYEALGCIDYFPESKVLGTTVAIKRPSGYGGSPCHGGSHEYVRFFVDYDHSGNWVDEGLAEFGVYDRNFGDVLYYYAKISLTPDKTACCDRSPVLPKVRAILSWNQVPTVNDPDFVPVWGESKESTIQIAPRNSFWCYFIHEIELYPKFKVIWPELYKPDFEKKYLPELEKLMPFDKPPVMVPPVPQPMDLKKAYGKKVSDARIAQPYMQAMLKSCSAVSDYQMSQVLPDFNIGEILGVLTQSQFDTTYEEVCCVGLDRDANVLHASVKLKLSCGYSGNLCSAGSKEYVAFYMDFGDGWEYMGTSHVTVHDIAGIPAEGLWYDVSLGVNLDAHRKKWCQVGKAKVRAILSWAAAPTPNDPDYVATWGDWQDGHVEIKPLPAGVIPGDHPVVVMEKCGGMVVADIDKTTGLGTWSLAGSLAGAKDSPFYGTMELIGHIFFGGPGWKYRFLVTQPGGVEHALLDTQVITTDTLGVFDDVILNPDPQGWMDYLQSDTVNIVGGLLGRFGAYGEGMYLIRIQATNDNGWTVFNDPNGTVHFKVDAKAPAVSINLDPPAAGSSETTGNCADFVIPEVMTGTYSMADQHSGSFSIYVTPSNNAVVHVDGNPVSGYSYNGTAWGLPNAGKSGTFEILTANMIKCGYNVRIDAIDRTIISSHVIGHRSAALQGFCLRTS